MRGLFPDWVGDLPQTRRSLRPLRISNSAGSKPQQNYNKLFGFHAIPGSYVMRRSTHAAVAACHLRDPSRA